MSAYILIFLFDNKESIKNLQYKLCIYKYNFLTTESLGSLTEISSMSVIHFVNVLYRLSIAHV